MRQIFYLFVVTNIFACSKSNSLPKGNPNSTVHTTGNINISLFDSTYQYKNDFKFYEVPDQSNAVNLIFTIQYDSADGSNFTLSWNVDVNALIGINNDYANLSMIVSKNGTYHNLTSFVAVTPTIQMTFSQLSDEVVQATFAGSVQDQNSGKDFNISGVINIPD